MAEPCIIWERDYQGCYPVKQVNEGLVTDMQEEIAPFALQYIGCAGNESRLVDCPETPPVDEPVDYVPYSFQDRDYVFGCGGQQDYARGDYFLDSVNGDVCDPYSANYARVACGALTAPSAISLWSRLHAWDLRYMLLKVLG